MRKFIIKSKVANEKISLDHTDNLDFEVTQICETV